MEGFCVVSSEENALADQHLYVRYDVTELEGETFEIKIISITDRSGAPVFVSDEDKEDIAETCLDDFLGEDDDFNEYEMEGNV